MCLSATQLSLSKLFVFSEINRQVHLDLLHHCELLLIKGGSANKIILSMLKLLYSNFINDSIMCLKKHLDFKFNVYVK